MERKLYQHIASALQAIENCKRSGNAEWEKRHAETIAALVKEHMPSGSGIDCGTSISLDGSTPNKLLFTADFHHMDEHGGYDGWTEHIITVTPDLALGFNLRITGRDRDGIKEYLAEVFANALDQIISDADYGRACGVLL